MVMLAVEQAIQIVRAVLDKQKSLICANGILLAIVIVMMNAQETPLLVVIMPILTVPVIANGAEMVIVIMEKVAVLVHKIVALAVLRTVEAIPVAITTVVEDLAEPVLEDLSALPLHPIIVFRLIFLQTEPVQTEVVQSKLFT